MAKEAAPKQEIGIWVTSFGGAAAGLAMGEQNVSVIIIRNIEEKLR